MNQKIVVRKIQLGEDEAIWRVAKTLGILERYIFYLLFYLSYKKGKVNLVAVDRERIVGCVIPRVTTLVGEKIGIVDLIFVDRNVQGRGVGKSLVEAAMSHFQKEGCKTNYALVDRFNSPSWNMFLHKEFTPFEFNEQFRVFSWKIFLLWWVSYTPFSPGTFILRRTDKESPITRETGAEWHFLLAWLGFSFVLWAVSIRFDAHWLNSIPFVLGVIGVSIFVHELAHNLVARFFGLKTIFKIWESGLIFSVFWSLLGTLLPFYGSTFIRQKDWSYNKHLRKMGLIYMAGPISSLMLAACFLALSHWISVDWLVVLGIVGFWVNSIIVFFNLVPIFPFASFDGKKIFLWNKTVWSLLVIWFVLLLGVKILL